MLRLKTKVEKIKTYLHIFSSTVRPFDFLWMKSSSNESLKYEEHFCSPKIVSFERSKCSKNGPEVCLFSFFFKKKGKKVEFFEKSYFYRAHILRFKIGTNNFFNPRCSANESWGLGEHFWLRSSLHLTAISAPNLALKFWIFYLFSKKSGKVGKFWKKLLLQSSYFKV